jgi:hypothetical protein
MLTGDLGKGAMKGTGSREPFVDHHREDILVIGRAGLALKLFRGHIARCACHVLHTLGARGLGKQGNAKVAEQELLASSHQQVLWFDVAVNEVLVVGVLQGIRNLLDIAQDCGERQCHPFGMSLAYGATRGIVHDRKGRFAFDPKNVGLSLGTYLRQCLSSSRAHILVLIS